MGNANQNKLRILIPLRMAIIQVLRANAVGAVEEKEVCFTVTGKSSGDF